MDAKHIVFLDMNKTSSGEEYIKSAKRLGFYVTFATFNPDFYLKPGETPETSILRYADHILTVDTHNDVEGLIRKLEEYGQKRPIDGIIGTLDLEVWQAMRVAERLGLPGSSPEAVAICRNKYLTRSKLHEKGIPTPRFVLIDSIEKAQQAGQQLGYPCVLKPLDCLGSEGVQQIGASHEFAEPFRWHQDNLDYWREVKKNPQMMVEEYMEGPLVSVETVSYNGEIYVLGCCDRQLTTPPFFAELGASFPAEFEWQEEAITMTKQALQAVGLDFGPAHTELILTKDGPRIVEINPRIVGTTISLLMNKCRGYSVHEEILKMVVGLPASFAGDNRGVGIIQSILPAQGGELIAIQGSEEARQMPGVVKISFDKGPGDLVMPNIVRNEDSIGTITVYGETKEQAQQFLQAILDKLNIVVATEQEAVR